MCAIMNFNYPWMNPTKDENEDDNESVDQKIIKKKVNPESIGSFNESGDWQLTNEEITWINKHFSQLQVNR